MGPIGPLNLIIIVEGVRFLVYLNKNKKKQSFSEKVLDALFYPELASFESVHASLLLANGGVNVRSK